MSTNCTAFLAAAAGPSAAAEASATQQQNGASEGGDGKPRRTLYRAPSNPNLTGSSGSLPRVPSNSNLEVLDVRGVMGHPWHDVPGAGSFATASERTCQSRSNRSKARNSCGQTLLTLLIMRHVTRQHAFGLLWCTVAQPLAGAAGGNQVSQQCFGNSDLPLLPVFVYAVGEGAPEMVSAIIEIPAVRACC